MTKSEEESSAETSSSDFSDDARDVQHPTPMTDRVLASWEIVSVVSSFLIAAWMVKPFAGSHWPGVVPIGLALGFILWSHRARHESWRELGWRFDNFWKAWRLLLWPMFFGACLVLAFGWLKHSLHFDKALLWRWSLWLPVWGLAQQYVLQGFINRRAQIVCGESGALSILIVAIVFAILHLPNPLLSLATFAGGAVWAYVYQRAPNLFALGLSHGVMSLLLASSISASTLNNLRIGFRFFN